MQNGVTLALVCHNEALSLPRLFESLKAFVGLSFPWEILFIDNESTDSTPRLVEDFCKKNQDIPFRYIKNEQNHLGEARRLAMNQARYPVVGFTDADCVVQPDWLQRSYERIQAEGKRDPKLLALGGGNLVPPEEEPFYQGLRICLSTFLGGMNTMQAKPPVESKYVDHLPTCNVFYFREKALAVGNFSAEFSDVCEDLEFSLRAIMQGFRLLYVPGLEVWHYHNVSVVRWAEKMFRYGRGQIQVAKRFPGHLLGVKGLPLLFGLAFLVAFFVRPQLTLALGALYAGILGCYAFILCFSQKRLRLFPQVLLLFMETHFFYAAGELWGVCLLGQKKNGKVDRRKG